MTSPANDTLRNKAASLSRVGAASCRRLSAVVLVVLAGCASPTAPVFHTLLPVDRPVSRSGTPGPVVRLDKVRVPPAIEQPQWLIRLPDGTLTQLERERWASLPSDEITQALRELLRLGFNTTEPTVGGARPAWRVQVEVLRFETLPGEVRLEVAWGIHADGAGGGVVRRCTSYHREAASGGMAALGAAHRRAVAQLGQALGEQLLSLQRNVELACPT